MRIIIETYLRSTCMPHKKYLPVILGYFVLISVSIALIIVKILLVFGEYKISVLLKFDVNSAALTLSHILPFGNESVLVRFLMNNSNNPKITGIRISNTVTQTLRFCRIQFLCINSPNCRNRDILLSIQFSH